MRIKFTEKNAITYSSYRAPSPSNQHYFSRNTQVRVRGINGRIDVSADLLHELERLSVFINVHGCGGKIFSVETRDSKERVDSDRRVVEQARKWSETSKSRDNLIDTPRQRAIIEIGELIDGDLASVFEGMKISNADEGSDSLVDRDPPRSETL